jgi:hypothetical protein
MARMTQQWPFKKKKADITQLNDAVKPVDETIQAGLQNV